MFNRIGSFLIIASLLLTTPIAHIGHRPESKMLVQTASVITPDRSADRVLGQAAFTTNAGGASAASLWLPAGVAIAPSSAPDSGRIFVVEYVEWVENVQYGNSRVLSWPSAVSFATGQAADLVIGQDDFTAREVGVGRNRFMGPEAAVVDAGGRLWVADTLNHRVLRFDPPFSNGMDASLVLGQQDFDGNNPNQGGGPAANTLYFPRGLAVDAEGNLYVADDFNHRVLRFSPPFEDNMPASLVIGQANFTQNAANRGIGPWPHTLNHPKGIAVDTLGNLYVAEYENNRVTRFTPPLNNGMNATGVYGQPGFVTIGGGIGPSSLDRPIDVAVSAGGESLFVTDQYNVRVLGFANPLGDAPGTASADEVYGQPDFFSATPNNGGISAASINEEPLGLAVDANGSLYHADFRNNRLLAYDIQIKMVGNGSAGSCTEAAFDAALTGGGTIGFNCGPDQIDLSNAKAILSGTNIDGGGVITLNGQEANRLFEVNTGASLTLRNITLTGGRSESDGGAISNNGTLLLDNVKIKNSQSSLSGGAIVSYGPMTIRNSLLEGNQALNGGALYPRWPGARTTILNSVLQDNHATDGTYGWGGAILLWDGAPVTILASDIYGNTARIGGAIYNFPNSFLTLGQNTQVRDNKATSIGGGLYSESGVLLTEATLSGNSASDFGGGVVNGNVIIMKNVTLSGNSTVGSGGGLYNANVAILTNITASGNSAVQMGGGIFSPAGSFTSLSNSILANSPGGNCWGGITDFYSLSSDNTCALGGAGSLNGIDPLLTDLGYYGSLVKVHMLRPGSPAIDLVATGCPPPRIDQRGVFRPVDGDLNASVRCDAGAVEVTQSDLIYKVYLPMITTD